VEDHLYNLRNTNPSLWCIAAGVREWEEFINLVGMASKGKQINLDNWDRKWGEMGDIEKAVLAGI
jgi:hypothetical protein